MPIRPIFLTWEKPTLPAAAEWLVARFRQNKRADLRQAIIVVPGRRAGRRLLEILVRDCEEQGLALSPPTITTEGRFPELLYTPKKPFANRLTQQLAWAKALLATPQNIRQRIVPQPPAEQAHDRWLALGEIIRKQHVDLAADGLSFADVAVRGAHLDGFDEHARWEALAAVQERYHHLLDELQLWDIQSARLFAIKHREPQSERPVFLLGTVDLNLATRQMLDLVADKVTTLIAAPESFAAAFDAHGCLLPEFWRNHALPIPRTKIFQAAGPQEQAEQVAQQLSELGTKYRGDEITVGVADESLVPQLQRRLEEGGVAARWGVGKLLSETLPYRLLAAVAEFADGQAYEAFAALIRHPDVYSWIQQHRIKAEGKHVACYLPAVDAYYADHLPRQFAGDWQAADDKHRVLKQVWEAVTALLGELPKAPQTLPNWCAAIRSLLANVYGVRTYDTALPTDHELLEVGRKIDSALTELEAVPTTLQQPLTLAHAMPLLLEPLAGEAIPPPAQPEAVEILGWLELMLDDAPALIVTTFNEGFVPQSQHADSFLPNRLREHLGLLDNERRYARDAYATQVLLAAREKVSFIVGSRDAEGNTLAPSRLLFARDAEEVVTLALRLFGKPSSRVARRSQLTDSRPPERSAFDVPPPGAESPWDDSSIRVTQFRSYLACRYRFYLEHVLRLRAIADSDVELSAANFGNLLHDVLQAFGADGGINRSNRPREIEEFLNAELERTAARRLGKLRRGAVNVQLEQARARLRAFADWQAKRSDDGWQIAYVEEQQEKLRMPFAVDDRSVELVGRIDRIDWHAQTDRWLILDYKTSDAADDPGTVHRRRNGDWTDLQLPLYRHLAQSVKFTSGQRLSTNLQLGYIQLPKDVTKVSASIAEWSAGDLAAADECARDVVRGIWRREFWPRNEAPPKYASPFAAICQDNLLDRQPPDLESLEEAWQ